MQTPAAQSGVNTRLSHKNLVVSVVCDVCSLLTAKLELENTIIPIEVKSWESVRSQSLEVFSKKYNIKNAIRVSAKNFGFENGIKSIPLYAVWCIDHSQPVFRE